MPVTKQDLIADLNILLDTAEAQETLQKQNKSKTELFDNIGKGGALWLINSWGEISSILFQTYRVEHGNLKLNPMLKAGLIRNLETLAFNCIIQLDQELETLPEYDLNQAGEIFKFITMIAEYHSVNDHLSKYREWLANAKYIREKLRLSKHLSNAAFLEFEASEISRRSKQKDNHGSIDDCIALFKQSIQVYAENNISLDGECVSARHAQNSLCVAISKQGLALVESAKEITPELKAELAQKSKDGYELLYAIQPFFLKPGVDFKQLHDGGFAGLNKNDVADGKRLSNSFSTEALMDMCNGRINNRTGAILQASLECMPVDATAQYANTLNRNANFLIAAALIIYRNTLTKEVNQATQDAMQAIIGHEYAAIAEKFYNCKDENLIQDANKETADAFVEQAVAYYILSYSTTRSVGESYGNIAQDYLVKLAKHPACQTEQSLKIIGQAPSAQPSRLERGRAIVPQFSRSQKLALTLAAPLVVVGVAMAVKAISSVESSNPRPNF